MIIFLITLFYYPIFSQNNYKIIPDSIFSLHSFSNNINNFSIINGIVYKKPVNNLYRPFNENYLPFNDPKMTMFLTQDYFKKNRNTYNFDNLPILNPKGNYSMMVIIPDPSIDYSLLIKEPR